MEKILEFYREILASKLLNESVIETIKKSHTKRVKEIEVETANREQNENEIEDEIENEENAKELEEIDQILLKAESLISQLELGKLTTAGIAKKPATTTTTKSTSTTKIEKKTESKQSGAKQTHPPARPPITRNLSASNLSKIGKTVSTNETKKKSLPVYLKAPYKTQPVKPMKRVNSASSLSLLRMGSESKETIKREDEPPQQVEKSQQIQQKPAISTVNTQQEPVNKPLKKSQSLIEKNVPNVKPFEKGVEQRLPSFKLDFESNKEIEIDPDLKKLVDLSRKLDQSIRKELKNRVQSQTKTSFFTRLKNITRSNESASTLLVNNKVVESEFKYKMGLETLDALIFDHFVSNSKTKRGKNSKTQMSQLFDVKLIVSEAERFSQINSNELNNVKIAELNSARKAQVRIERPDKELALRFSHKIRNCPQEQTFFYYENLQELKSQIESECSLIEVKYRLLLLDLLEKFLAEYNLIEQRCDSSYYYLINSLFNLIRASHTIIVKS